ncbi:hypothetical protein DEJ50_00225 [Streptomyces venezuelae]|uniref:Uncharacterized protein n=1 Tax=Streptomyces venezuelae TaxID=54571 RepID=A0A5P2DA61_STRVZ|nr:hypothetical protein DEJ50_00225 [Streptomyces venezuelae]
MPPSTLTLLGRVRHRAEVERAWFRRVIAGQDIPWCGRRTATGHQQAPHGPGPRPRGARAVWSLSGQVAGRRVRARW